MNNLLVVTVR